MATILAIAGIVIAAGAFAVSVLSALFARRQLRMIDRQHKRDFGATVVAELIDASQDGNGFEYLVSVTNAGPAVASDVDLSLVAWSHESAVGRVLTEAPVAPALLLGEQRQVVLRMAPADARFDDRGMAVELWADYYDDNGVRSERLALVLEDSFILTPPFTGRFAVQSLRAP